MRSFGFALLLIFVSVFIILVCAEVLKRLIDFMGSKKMTDANTILVVAHSLFIVFISFLLIFRIFSCVEGG